MAPRSFLKRKPKMVVRASILARMLVKFSTHQSVWLHAALIVFVTQAALAKDVCDTQSAKGDDCLCELSDLQSWSVGVGVKRKLTLRRYQMRRVLCVPLSRKRSGQGNDQRQDRLLLALSGHENRVEECPL